MSIRIENEGREIIRTVLRMNAHSSIVASAVGQGRLMESRRRLSRRRPESHVEALARRNDSFLTKADCKFILGPG